MKLRIIEIDGRFYPQRRWFYIWKPFIDSDFYGNKFDASFDKFEYAKGFLDDVSSGARSPDGSIIEKKPPVTIHPYP